MTAVLPHLKTGPANYQASTLIYGGMVVQATTATAGTTDLTVKPALAATIGTNLSVLGVAGIDANVISTQTGAANSYGQPQIDISVLGDYVSVYYGGVDIWVWYANTAAVLPGAPISVDITTNGTVTAFSGTSYGGIIGRCTHPGGVSTAMCTQQIGGTGAATFFLGRARISV
jgi:hypothetical protein